MNKIIVNSNPHFGRTGLIIRKTIEQSLKALNKNNFAVEVYLVKNAEIKRLNRFFRGKNKVAEVLSFSAVPEFPRPDIQPPFRYLGEIYLAPDFIKKRKYNLKQLAIHGLLHLLGYTHQRKDDRMKMEKLETWLN